MDMLRAFFEIGADASYFEGLEIMQEKTLCENYMGKFPVIFISLKNIDGLAYESAVKKMSGIIRREARRLQFLIDSDKLPEVDKDYMKTFLGSALGRFLTAGVYGDDLHICRGMLQEKLQGGLPHPCLMEWEENLFIHTGTNVKTIYERFSHRKYVSRS